MLVAGGASDVTTYFALRLAADGTAATGLTITGFDLQYVRSGAVAVAKVDATALGGVGNAHSDNTAIEVDATDQPGLYRVDWPDAAFADGVREVILSVKVATAFTEHLRVEIDAEVNVAEWAGTDVVAGAIPAVAADAAGGLAVSDAGGLDLDQIGTDTAAVLVDTADMQPKLGTPAADLAADIAAVKVDTAAVLVDTADMQPKLGTPSVDISADIAALNDLSAAQVNAECDTAIADAALATAANLATVDGVVDAILVDTADMQPKLGSPAADVSADIAAVKAETASIQAETTAILADTADMQPKLGVPSADLAADIATRSSHSADDVIAAVSGTADSGTTTTLVDAARTEGDTDYWKGSVIVITSGNIAGQMRRITAFDAGTDTLTVDTAFTQAVGTNTYIILRVAYAEAPAAGSGDWSTAEKEQFRDALGVDGTKTAAVGGQLQVVDANVDLILVDTAELGAAVGASISADIAAVKADTGPILVDTANMQPKLGTPAADISADVAAVKVDTAAILVDTGTTLDAKIDDIQGAGFVTGDDSLEAIRDRGDAAWTTGAGSGLTPLASGTAQGGTASTIQLAAGESFANDELNGNVVKVTGGTGAGQSRVITDYVGATDTATVTPNWITNPGADSVYEVVNASANIVAVSNVAEDLATATALAAVQADTDDIQTRIPAALVGGAMDSDVSAIQAGALTAAAVATDAFDADALAADAVAEIQVGLATAAALATVNGDVGLILADTADMQPKLGSPAADVSADIAAVKVDTAAILTDTADMQPKLGAPAADVSADIAAVKAETASIQAETTPILADTADMQPKLGTPAADVSADIAAIDSRIPAALVSSRMDSNVSAIADNAEAATDLSFSARTIVRATVDTVVNTHTPTTTEFQADDVTEATADHFNGRIVIFTSGVLKDQATDITDYVAVGGIGQFTVTAMTEAPSNNDTFVIV